MQFHDSLIPCDLRFFFLSTSLYPLQSICNSLKNFNMNLLLPPLHSISISNYDLNYKFSFLEWEGEQWLQKTESAEFEFLWKLLIFTSNIFKKVINPALPVDISMPHVLTKVFILLYYVNCHFSWARDFSPLPVQCSTILFIKVILRSSIIKALDHDLEKS